MDQIRNIREKSMGGAGEGTLSVMPSVTVIMSAYNGEQFIREQIDSILNQTYKNVTLYVRDDGSTDRTRQILETYASERKLIYEKGKNRGFIRSFLLALKHCPEADYYAWCDQDDVWMPDKIERAVKILENQAGKERPALYFTDYDFYDEHMRYTGHGLVHKLGPSFANSLMDCISLGFNSVFNEHARKMMLQNLPRHSCGHDWWTYMICAAFGEVIYDRGYISVKYRRLSTSVSPGGLDFVKQQIWRFKKFFINDYFADIRMQLREYAHIYLPELEKNDPKKARLLRLFSFSQNTPLRVICKVLYPVRFRQVILEEIMIRTLFLMGKL